MRSRPVRFVVATVVVFAAACALQEEDPAPLVPNTPVSPTPSGSPAASPTPSPSASPSPSPSPSPSASPSPSPTPTPTPTPSPSPSPSPGLLAVVTVGPNGVTPQNVVVAVGGRVRFVNDHTIARQIFSDPHPGHLECPEINAVGALAAGAAKETSPFAAAKTCGYHDDAGPGSAAVRGTISVR